MEGNTMIYHICPHCGADLKTPKQGAGREVVCGRCGKNMECPREPFLIPSLPEEEMIWSSPTVDRDYARYSILAAILAYISFFCTGPLTALPAVILGHSVLHPILRGEAPRSLLLRTLWALFLAYTNLILFFLFIMPMMASLSQVHEASGRGLCNSNLRQIGEAFKAYSAAHKGAYPALSNVPGQLMCFPEGICPEFVKDPFWFVCVRSPMMHDRNKRLAESYALVNDECYFYLGHAVTNSAEVEAFCSAYKEAVHSGTSWQKALHVPPGKGFEGSDVIPLLGEVVEGKASHVPIMIERHQNHPGEGHGVYWFFSRIWNSTSRLSQCFEGGGHVLYLDGHVEFRKYPDEWPMTEKTVQALEQIHGLQPEQK